MRALVIRNPWASLIASGEKTIEVRSWRTHFRGPFVMCASAGKPPLDLRTRFPEHSAAPRGVTVAVVELVDVRPATPDDDAAACDPTQPGEYAWIVRVVKRLPPTPVKGRLGFFELDDAIAGGAS